MKRNMLLVLSIVAVLAVVAFAFQTNSSTLPETADASLTVANEAAGMRVYIDQDTGEFTGPPVPAEEFPPMNALNMSDEGLVVEDSPVSGKMVNLQGRFQHSYTANVDVDGKLAAGCDIYESVENIASTDEKE